MRFSNFHRFQVFALLLLVGATQCCSINYHEDRSIHVHNHGDNSQLVVTQQDRDHVKTGTEISGHHSSGADSKWAASKWLGILAALGMMMAATPRRLNRRVVTLSTMIWKLFTDYFK